MGHGPRSSTLVCICVFRLLFVLFYVLFVCKCVLPPGDNPIAVNKYRIISYFFLFGATSPSGPGPPNSRGLYITLNDTPQSVGRLCTSDQLVAETSTWRHTTLKTDRHSCLWWDSNPQSQQALGRRPWPQTAWQLGPAPDSIKMIYHTQRCTTVGTTPLDKWSARRRDLYLTTHNTENRHSCLWWDSNPQSQQAIGRRPWPQTAWQLGPAPDSIKMVKSMTVLWVGHAAAVGWF